MNTAWTRCLRPDRLIIDETVTVALWTYSSATASITAGFDTKNFQWIEDVAYASSMTNIALSVSTIECVESMKLNPKMDDLPVLYFDNTAIAFGSSQFHYRMVNGNEFDLKTRWSATVVKEGDRWLLANVHVSSNLFDNPVLQTVSRMAIWLAIGTGAISLVVGFIVARLIYRKVNDLTY